MNSATHFLRSCCNNKTLVPSLRVGSAVFARRNLSSNAVQSDQAVKLYSSSFELKRLQIEDVDKQLKTVSYIDEGDMNSTLPPLVILGGTAQTINTYTPHIQGLKRKRRLIIVEMRGQGQTELDSQHCTMPQLVSDLRQILGKLNIKKINLSGFSFGGRVALTYTAKHPDMVHRLSVTAVPLIRPPLGKLIIQSWEDALSRGNLRECAWSFIVNGYSEDFIQKYCSKLPSFVDYVIQANKPENLYNLVRMSHINHGGDEYTIEHCTKEISCPVQVIAASEDRIAGYEHTLALARALNDCEIVTLKAGHLVPFEDTTEWRNAVLKFLDQA